MLASGFFLTLGAPSGRWLEEPVPLGWKQKTAAHSLQTARSESKMLQVSGRSFLYQEWVPLDKDEGFVKHRLALGGAQAPLSLPALLRTRAFANHATSSFEGHVFRPTNHRYGHSPQAMMLPCEHPAYCRMRERSFKVTTSLVPVRGTPELLSIWAISG